MEQATIVRRAAAQAEFEVAEATRATTEAMIRQADQTSVLITATRQGEAALRAQEEIFELQNAALQEGIDLTTKQGQAWEDAFRSVQIFNAGLEDTQKQMEETKRLNEQLGDSIGDAMNDAIDSMARGESEWDSFKGVAVSALQEIQRELIRTFARRAVSGDESGFGLGDIFGSIAGLFGGGGGGGLSGSFIPQAFPASFAHGGTAVVGGSGGTDSKLAMLRVTPREEITVRTPEQQRAARGGGAGVTIHQSFDFRGAEPGVFARAQAFKEQIKQETVAMVFGLINDGGREAIMTGRRKARR